MQAKKTIIASIVFIFLVILAFNAVHAVGYGYSKVTLTQYSVNISQGSSANIGFTISLFNGSYWGTSIAESPSNNYITFTPSVSNQDPTYSGTLTISVAKGAPKGTYTFNISAVGDDPSVSPVQLTVNVLNSTSSTPPSVIPPVSSTPKPMNYFDYVGSIFLVLIIVLLGLGLSMKKKFAKAAKYTMLVSIVLSLAAAVYLLAYDSLLRISGMLHYDILIVFFILTIILAYLIYGNKKMHRNALLVLGSLSALFVLAMFLDAILGLPLTQISGSLSYGFNYLFGFGAAGTYSSYSISLAFSILLLSVTATSILSLFSYLFENRKK
ncbi:MAG: hypothetical protein ACP5MV_02800 [Candidatus Parvarchaeum sp.]